ncbi:MAG: helix-hairpin-helix domain-containing protein [Deltaproteobacteria bacterium]|nr:helix-hairpin-helix domain-containing protein [Deltaproteobacteria bacterium]
MKHRQAFNGLLLIVLLGAVFLFAGTSHAQHEGGLGIKKVPLNIATAEQLLKIKGMTEELAEAIVKYREKSGFFKKPEDLLKVPGMTKDVYDQLDPQVGSEGDLYCIPKEGDEGEDEEDEEPVLSPSKC